MMCGVAARATNLIDEYHSYGGHLRRTTMLIFGAMLLATALLWSGDGAEIADRGDINVVITGLRNADGEVLISLYNKAEGFPKDRSTIIRAAAVIPDDCCQKNTGQWDSVISMVLILGIENESGSG